MFGVMLPWSVAVVKQLKYEHSDNLTTLLADISDYPALNTAL